MANNLQEELDQNKFLFVKYGLLVTFFVLLLIMVALAMLKIGDQSILSMVFEYYVR